MNFSIKQSIKISLKSLAMLVGISFLSSTAIEAVGAKASSFTSPQDAFSSATNPALSILVGSRVDGCVRWFHNPLHSSVKGSTIPGFNGHYDAAKKDNFYFIEGAINKTFKTCFRNRIWEWSLGLFAYTDTFLQTSYKVPIVIDGTTPLGAQGWNQVYGPVFALKVNDKHQIGISIDIYHKRVNVHGFELIDNPATTIYPGFVTNKGYSHAWGCAPTIGWRWEATKNLRFAAIYRPKIAMSKFHKYKGLYPQAGESDVPQKVGVGIGYTITKKLGASFDFEWNNYNDVQLHFPLLNENGGVDKGGTRHAPYHGFRDLYIYRLGVGYTISDAWTVRAGYVHNTKVIPRNQTLINLDICYAVTDLLAANVTYTWCKKNEITVLYSHGFENTVKGRHSIPPVISPGGGEVSLRESRDNLLVNYGRKF